MIITEQIIYQGPGGSFEGTVSWDDSISGKRPGVLVCHAFGGQTRFDTNKAEKLAELGYVGFAIDNYGQGNRGATPEESRAFMAILNEDRPLLLARMETALDVMKDMANVDENRTAAIGFCFGGKCVFDLARSGADIKGVVSFHGLFDQPPVESSKPIKASVLALHGWDDPLATPEQTVEFAAEMTARNADWQIQAYGHTGHSFTNPVANSPETGMAFNAITDTRSWLAMKNFLAEVLHR